MIQTKAEVSGLEALRVDPGRLEYLDSYLKQLAVDNPNTFTAVRALRYGKVIFNGAYGTGSLDGTPLAEDAIYPLASITKPIIATLLALLMEDGVIDFWDRFNRYFPEFTGGKKDEVELWQVLAHCSGMSDERIDQYFGELCAQLGIDTNFKSDEEYEAAFGKIRTQLGMPEVELNDKSVDETYNAVQLSAPLTADPGTGFNYCNTAYNLMKKLIEKLTGETIDAFASRRLFKPLGMRDTHFLLPKDKWPRVVKRDPSFHGADWFNSDNIMTNTNGASGLKSTMADLTRFGQMWLQQGTLDGARILSPATIRLMTTDHNAKLPPSFWGTRWLSCSWGLGWNVCFGKKDDLGLLRSPRAYDHAGAGGGRIMIDPDNNLVVAFYVVEHTAMSYEYQSTVANILYSALD
jgi:CubicO group peptidase (beta-lactamase class C family)